ncbi:glycoside hydrolase family 3 N-terminal domain-containing protein [Demequina aurantiaca]|uniref:glycoside hydrolase family 3 N-terminal domain-containing protein n=1 Tax=Demequina aurantiaca TaxID=676200 RepID=UPI003D359638
MARSWGMSVAVGAVAVAAIGAVIWASSGPGGDADTPVPGPSASASPTELAPSPSQSASASAQPTLAPLAWGPTQADWDAALATARSLTLKEAAGQVVVAAYAGTSPADLTALIEKYGLGGVMLQGDATSDQDVVTALTAAAAATGADADWPVMIAVDQEGGVVARLRGMMPDLPGFMAAGAATDKSMVRQTYATQGAYVAALGFNTNFAPDADVTDGLSDPVIRTRSAGSDPQNVAATVDAAVAGYTDAGLVTTIKHFPGHGSVDTDSHEGLPVQSAPVADLEKRDLVPFASAIDAGAPAVMMGHIALAEWGGDAATLSPGAYAYLRDDLGFTGVAMTDAMNMGAIIDNHKAGAATVLALKAGADMVLMPADTAAAVSAIIAAVESGDLPRERLDQAAGRSILLMQWQAGLDAMPIPAGSEDFASKFAAVAATVVTPTCGVPLVGDTVTVIGGWDYERAALAGALADRGIGAGTAGEPGSIVQLASDSSEQLRADVVVAVAGPWVLERATATTYIALYGRSADALEGLAEVLVGNAHSGSSWPVKLENVHAAPC